VRLAAKLLGWKIDIKSEEEKRQEVEHQMQAMSGGPSTPIEQVSELGEQIIQKLVAAGITTVEALADMTPEQLEEIPGIGERTLEKIGTAVRHYFGQYEEGEEHAGAASVESAAGASHPLEEGVAAGEGEGDMATAAGTTGELTEAEQERLEADPELAQAAAIERDAAEEEETALRLEDEELTEELPDDSNSSGLIVDEIAAQRMEKLTESGEDVGEFGVEILTPGRDDTSAVLSEHRPRAAGLDGELADAVDPDESESKQHEE
jgi:N utilization substance protein A